MLEHLQSLRPDSKAFANISPQTCRGCIQLVVSPTCLQISLPNIIKCSRTLAWSTLALPRTDVACAYLHFLMDFVVGKFSSTLNYTVALRNRKIWL
jgi:hypothetical protein